MAYRWGNNGNSERLFFWAPKITADGDCIYEIKNHVLFGRKVMTNLDSILKSKDITLPTVHAAGSSSSLDRAISVGRERWKCSQAWGWLVIPNSRGRAVGGNHDFYFSCGSKIMFSLGPEPHTLGCPAPC